MATVAVIGLGLMGSSFALALKETGNHVVVGSDRDPRVVQKALDRGIVSSAASDMSIVEIADVVVLALPIRAMRETLNGLRGRIAGKAVTDMASTKARVMQWAKAAEVTMVGGHPMCGKESSGIDAADATLFEGAAWVLTADYGAVTKLVESVGAHPVFMNAETHDRLVAGVSHAAFLLSIGYVLALSHQGDWLEASKVASSGFRDMSRLAAGDISKSDKNQIEIAAERFELDARSADTTAATLRLALEALLGSTHPTGDWVAVDTLDSLISTAPAEDNISAEPRPDLLAAEAGLKKTEADMRLQKALRIPDPTVQVLYEHEPPDQPNTLGLGLSFPLPLWNRNRGGIRSAEAARDQALLAIGKVRTQIGSEIESARLRYRDAADRWRRYRDEIQPRSEEVREAVSFAYAKGGAALLDLLTAERNANDVRLATSQAAADSALAGATLQAALNLPGAGADRK